MAVLWRKELVLTCPMASCRFIWLSCYCRVLVAFGDALFGTAVDLKTMESLAVDESGGDRDCALLAWPKAAYGMLARLESFGIIRWYWFAVAYGEVRFRLLELSPAVFWVAATPTLVKYDALPLPIALKPKVSFEAFFFTLFG